MDILNLVTSGVVAAFISGILVFTYQQWLQVRLKRVEAQVERQRAYEKMTHEMLAKGYARIWTGLVEIEDWLKRRMWDEIGSQPVLDPNQQWNVIFDTYKGFRGEMLFLSEPLYQRTRRLILDLETNLNSLLDVVRVVLVEKEANPDGYSTNPKLVSMTNDALSKVIREYSEALEDIRRDYQSITRELLLGPNAEAGAPGTD